MKHLRYMVIFPLLLIMVSIVVGWRCYSQAKTEMVEDLNQALQRTTVADEGVDALLDSRSCASHPCATRHIYPILWHRSVGSAMAEPPMRVLSATLLRWLVAEPTAGMFFWQ